MHGVTLDHIAVPPPVDDEIVDPMAWFETPGPFELEIGCGKGGFLLSRARAHPELRLLGIEWANKYFKFAADRLARWKLTNARVMRTDAGIFVTRHLPPRCLSALHVYHPDPWPKKRHHKRRLIRPDFVHAVVRVLKPDARLLIQTDHEEYFAASRDLLVGQSQLSEIPWGEDGFGAGPEWEGTNFEIKYAREGRKIYRASYRVNP